jgi:hypothetical protein
MLFAARSDRMARQLALVSAVRPSFSFGTICSWRPCRGRARLLRRGIQRARTAAKTRARYCSIFIHRLALACLAQVNAFALHRLDGVQLRPPAPAHLRSRLRWHGGLGFVADRACPQHRPAPVVSRGLQGLRCGSSRPFPSTFHMQDAVAATTCPQLVCSGDGSHADDALQKTAVECCYQPSSQL